MSDAPNTAANVLAAALARPWEAKRAAARRRQDREAGINRPALRHDRWPGKLYAVVHTENGSAMALSANLTRAEADEMADAMADVFGADAIAVRPQGTGPGEVTVVP